MKITRDMLRGWEACRDSYEWFLRRFPAGDAAGEGWACFAGLRVRVAQWSALARVIAKTRPANLHGGHWVESPAPVADDSEQTKEAA